MKTLRFFYFLAVFSFYLGGVPLDSALGALPEEHKSGVLPACSFAPVLPTFPTPLPALPSPPPDYTFLASSPQSSTMDGTIQSYCRDVFNIAGEQANYLLPKLGLPLSALPTNLVTIGHHLAGYASSYDLKYHFDTLTSLKEVTAEKMLKYFLLHNIWLSLPKTTRREMFATGSPLRPLLMGDSFFYLNYSREVPATDASREEHFGVERLTADFRRIADLPEEKGSMQAFHPFVNRDLLEHFLMLLPTNAWRAAFHGMLCEAFNRPGEPLDWVLDPEYPHPLGLSPKESALISEYTGTGYILNEFLRGDPHMTAKVREAGGDLIAAINLSQDALVRSTLPLPIVSFRADSPYEEMSSEAYFEKYRPGATIIEDSFLSMTTNPTLAMEWRKADGYALIYIGRRGVSVSSLSLNVHENEILYPRGTRWQVTARDEVSRIIYLYEMDDPPSVVRPILRVEDLRPHFPLDFSAVPILEDKFYDAFVKKFKIIMAGEFPKAEPDA